VALLLRLGLGVGDGKELSLAELIRLLRLHAGDELLKELFSVVDLGVVQDLRDEVFGVVLSWLVVVNIGGLEHRVDNLFDEVRFRLLLSRFLPEVEIFLHTDGL